jgi:four helix bundle protein
VPHAVFVVAKDFHELQCWQLAHARRTKVNAVCAKPEVCNDYKFCNSFRDTAASVGRNISAGFTRFTSPYIVQYFGCALWSIAELKDHFAE